MRVEVIEVQCREGVPVQFRRPASRARASRRYRVRAVLGFWVEGTAWWRSKAVRAVLGRESHVSIDTTPELDRTIWRVEARAGEQAQVGVYDLVRDGDGAWSLTRAAD